MTQKTKVCKMCKKELPVKDFPKDNRSKDGLWRFCRSCESSRKKELRQRKNLEDKKLGDSKTKKDSTEKSGPVLHFIKVCENSYGRTLGRFEANVTKSPSNLDKIICFNSVKIKVFLPRVLLRSQRHMTFSFDLMFSEVISHEWLHYLLYREVGIKAGHGLDNLFGQIGWDSIIGDGLSK